MLSIKDEVESLRDLIYYVLDKFPKTRGSDTLLYIQCCELLGAKTTEHLKEIPINIISIHKARQIIQNKEGKYLPDENIQKVRKQRDKEFKAYLQKIKN